MLVQNHSLLYFIGVFVCFVECCFASEIGVKLVKAPSQDLALPWQMVNYIEPHDLAAMIKEGDNSFLVVDVRDEDYNVKFKVKEKI